MKPVLTAAAREAARARTIEEAYFRDAIAHATAVLIEAGWSNVTVQRKANFIAISGDDPAGVNHSGAMTDGQALADFLISIGIKPPFRRTTAQAVLNVRHTRAAVATAPGEDTDLVKSLRARISELESRPPEIREVEKIVERVVEVPAAVEAETPGDGIPDEFRGLMVPDESPEKFTERMKRRWQALQHLRIDGSKPTNSRALPDMTEEEIAELADLEARNKTGKWLD